LPLVASRSATLLTEACAAADALGYPVVLKAMVGGVAHKHAAGLVALSIGNRAELVNAHAIMSERTQGKAGVGFLLQPMISAKWELIIGVAREAELGHFLVFGLGGLNTEWFDQVLLLPIELDIATMRERIAQSRLGTPLREPDGAGRPALDQLTPVLAGLQQLVEVAGDQIESVELNPLIVTKTNDVVAVDALIVRRSTR